ncbi:unnamed protein product [Protopolystoma xenopodis]|uniref:Uncharacterized protein n=1 Tax=Protopolystoma xenopodis TaxID=117903 RepID=A0A448XEX7_9PLAT|nr:unnamed protein product [Protopolystoma xenopodis]
MNACPKRGTAGTGQRSWEAHFEHVPNVCLMRRDMQLVRSWGADKSAESPSQPACHDLANGIAAIVYACLGPGLGVNREWGSSRRDPNSYPPVFPWPNSPGPTPTWSVPPVCACVGQKCSPTE